jgi:soluble P-type ATPase
MTVTEGNGGNDALLLRRALLGIYLVQGEGASSLALVAADVIAVDIAHVADMLIKPSRLAATLRN